MYTCSCGKTVDIDTITCGNACAGSAPASAPKPATIIAPTIIISAPPTGLLNCSENYVEACSCANGGTGTHQCHKQGQSTTGQPGPSCPWGAGSSCNACTCGTATPTPTPISTQLTVAPAGGSCNSSSTNGCAGQNPGFIFAIGTDCMICNGSAGQACTRTFTSCPGGGYKSVPAIPPSGGITDPSSLQKSVITGGGSCSVNSATSPACVGQSFGYVVPNTTDVSRGIEAQCVTSSGGSCTLTYVNTGTGVTVTKGNCPISSADGCVNITPGSNIVVAGSNLEFQCVMNGNGLCGRIQTTTPVAPPPDPKPDIANAGNVNTNNKSPGAGIASANTISVGIPIVATTTLKNVLSAISKSDCESNSLPSLSGHCPSGQIAQCISSTDGNYTPGCVSSTIPTPLPNILQTPEQKCIAQNYRWCADSQTCVTQSSNCPAIVAPDNTKCPDGYSFSNQINNCVRTYTPPTSTPLSTTTLTNQKQGELASQIPPTIVDLGGICRRPTGSTTWTGNCLCNGNVNILPGDVCSVDLTSKDRITANGSRQIEVCATTDSTSCQWVDVPNTDAASSWFTQADKGQGAIIKLSDGTTTKVYSKSELNNLIAQGKIDPVFLNNIIIPVGQDNLPGNVGQSVQSVLDKITNDPTLTFDEKKLLTASVKENNSTTQIQARTTGNAQFLSGGQDWLDRTEAVLTDKNLDAGTKVSLLGYQAIDLGTLGLVTSTQNAATTYARCYAKQGAAGVSYWDQIRNCGGETIAAGFQGTLAATVVVSNVANTAKFVSNIFKTASTSLVATEDVSAASTRAFQQANDLANHLQAQAPVLENGTQTITPETTNFAKNFQTAISEAQVGNYEPLNNLHAETFGNSVSTALVPASNVEIANTTVQAIESGASDIIPAVISNSAKGSLTVQDVIGIQKTLSSDTIFARQIANGTVNVINTETGIGNFLQTTASLPVSTGQNVIFQDGIEALTNNVRATVTGAKGNVIITNQPANVLSTVKPTDTIVVGKTGPPTNTVASFAKYEPFMLGKDDLREVLTILYRVEPETVSGDALVQRILEDKNIVKQKYSLPDKNMLLQNPNEYYRQLESIAKEEGIPVRSKDEFDAFFKKYTSSAVYLNSDEYDPGIDGRTIVIDKSQNIENIKVNIDNSSTFEHELVHALQDKRYPGMSLVRKEYEAYLTSASEQFIKKNPLLWIERMSLSIRPDQLEVMWKDYQIQQAVNK